MRSPRNRSSFPAGPSPPPNPPEAEPHSTTQHHTTNGPKDHSQTHYTDHTFRTPTDPPPPDSPVATPCTVLPHRPAHWRVKTTTTSTTTNLPLSTLAATVLISEAQLSATDVELIPTDSSSANDSPPTDPLSSIALSTYATVSDVLLGAAAGPREAVRQLRKAHDDARVREAAAYSAPFAHAERASGRAYDVTDDDDDTTTYACRTPSETGTLRGDGDGDGEEKREKENPYKAVAVSSGLGVARIVGAGLKAPGLYTRGLARGFGNVPRLYGDETARGEERVDGVVSGLAAAGKGLGYGLYDGITGFFVQPVKGAREEGAVGFLKGFGKGLGGIVCKPAAGACGVPGYAFTGIQKSIESIISREASAEECFAAEEVLKGEEEMRGLTDKERAKIVSVWLARTNGL